MIWIHFLYYRSICAHLSKNAFRNARRAIWHYSISFKINDETKITSWINSFCKKEAFIIDSLVFAFFNDDDLKDLNIKYLNHNFYTDVISFDESKNSIIKGNIAISVDRVKDNASTFSSLFDDYYMIMNCFCDDVYMMIKMIINSFIFITTKLIITEL